MEWKVVLIGIPDEIIANIEYAILQALEFFSIPSSEVEIAYIPGRPIASFPTMLIAVYPPKGYAKAIPIHIGESMLQAVEDRRSIPVILMIEDRSIPL